MYRCGACPGVRAWGNRGRLLCGRALKGKEKWRYGPGHSSGRPAALSPPHRPGPVGGDNWCVEHAVHCGWTIKERPPSFPRRLLVPASPSPCAPLLHRSGCRSLLLLRLRPLCLCIVE